MELNNMTKPTGNICPRRFHQYDNNNEKIPEVCTKYGGYPHINYYLWETFHNRFNNGEIYLGYNTCFKHK